MIANGAGWFITVAERLKPESVYQRFLAFRQRLGFEVLQTTGGRTRSGSWRSGCAAGSSSARSRTAT